MKKLIAIACTAQWWPVHQRVMGLISDQGACTRVAGWIPGPAGWVYEGGNIEVSLCLSSPPTAPNSKNPMGKIASGED